MNPSTDQSGNLHSTASSLRMLDMSKSDWTDRFRAWPRDFLVTCSFRWGLGKWIDVYVREGKRQLPSVDNLDMPNTKPS